MHQYMSTHVVSVSLSEVQSENNLEQHRSGKIASIGCESFNFVSGTIVVVAKSYDEFNDTETSYQELLEMNMESEMQCEHI